MLNRASPLSITYVLVHTLLLVVGLALNAWDDPPWKVFVHSVATSLVGAAVVGYVIFIYVRLADTRMKLVTLIDKFGFVDAFEARAAAIKTEYSERLARNPKRIDVLGFGLRHLREDFADKFQSWTNTATVRVLLLDPTFPSAANSYATQRDKEEGNNKGQIRGDVEAFVDRVRTTFEDKKMNNPFEVRYLRALPSINIFRVGDEIFWGPYLVGRQSRNMPTFLVRKNSIMFENLEAHFDELWENHATQVFPPKNDAK